MKKLFLLSLMAMLLPLTTWAQQKTFTVEAEDVIYAGANTTTTVTVTVDGVDQALVEGTDYQWQIDGIGGQTVDKVGTYTVQVVGQGTYAFYQPATTTFTVDKKEVTGLILNTKGVSRVYDGTENDAVVLSDLVTAADGLVNNSKEEMDNFLLCLKVVRQQGQSGAAADGNYNVSVEGKAKTEETGSNYYFPEQTFGTWVKMNITKRPVTVSLDFTRAYNGEAFKPTNLNGRCSLENVVEADKENVKASLKYNGDKNLTDADKYELMVSLTGTAASNYLLTNETVEVEITKATLTITAKEKSEQVKWEATYGDEKYTYDLTDQFDFDKWVASESDDVKKSLTMEWVSTDDIVQADDYPVQPYVSGKLLSEENTLKNYEIVYKNIQKFTVKGKDITSGGITMEVTDLTYQGKEFSLGEGEDFLLSVKDGETPLENNVDYEVTVVNTENAINAASTFTVTIKGNGNYSGTKTQSDFTIAKATLYITHKTEEGYELEKVYNGTDELRDLTDYFAYDGLVNGENFSEIEPEAVMSMQKASGADVASYYVRPAKDGKTFQASEYGTVLTNYIIDYKVANDDNKFEITPATVTYWIKEATAVYNPNKTSDTKFEVVAEGFVKETDDFDEGHAPIVALAAKYDGVAKAVGTYDLVVTNAEVGAEAENAVTAKNYTVVYDDSKDGKFVITKQPLTITALSQTVDYTLAQEADLEISDAKTIVNEEGEAPTYTVMLNGLRLGSEKKAIVAALKGLKYSEEDLYKKVDEHKNGLQFVGTKEDVETANDNYDVTLVAGTLIVKGGESITLDGAVEDESMSELIAAYDNQKITVTVKNLKTLRDAGINADKWYTLVLPFEVTAREISNAFGYAIVNVPNTTNDKADEIHFKHTVGTIDANTLMVFKVDDKVDWESNKYKEGVTFTNKTIIAPSEWAADVAGNQFIGTYSPKGIEEATQYYINPTTGVFQNAANYVKSYGEPLTVNPLTGYVEFKELSANARIFVEDADGTVTAINVVNTDNVNAAEGWYTVGGVKLNAEPTEKGVYINNGKKVVIK